jgi:hypothetical protein
MTVTRRLAAILAADVAGYSRLIGAIRSPPLGGALVQQYLSAPAARHRDRQLLDRERHRQSVAVHTVFPARRARRLKRCCVVLPLQHRAP